MASPWLRTSAVFGVAFRLLPQARVFFYRAASSSTSKDDSFTNWAEMYEYFISADASDASQMVAFKLLRSRPFLGFVLVYKLILVVALLENQLLVHPKGLHHIIVKVRFFLTLSLYYRNLNSIVSGSTYIWSNINVYWVNSPCNKELTGIANISFSEEIFWCSVLVFWELWVLSFHQYCYDEHSWF